MVQRVLWRHRLNRQQETAKLLPRCGLGKKQAGDGSIATRSPRESGEANNMGMVRRAAQLDVDKQRGRGANGPHIYDRRSCQTAAQRKGGGEWGRIAENQPHGRVARSLRSRRTQGHCLQRWQALRRDESENGGRSVPRRSVPGSLKDQTRS